MSAACVPCFPKLFSCHCDEGFSMQPALWKARPLTPRQLMQSIIRMRSAHLANTSCQAGRTSSVPPTVRSDNLPGSVNGVVAGGATTSAWQTPDPRRAPPSIIPANRPGVCTATTEPDLPLCQQGADRAWRLWRRLRPSSDLEGVWGTGASRGPSAFTGLLLPTGRGRLKRDRCLSCLCSCAPSPAWRPPLIVRGQAQPVTARPGTTFARSRLDPAQNSCARPSSRQLSPSGLTGRHGPTATTVASQAGCQAA